MSKLHIPAAKMVPAIESGAIDKAAKEAGATTTKMYRVPIDKIRLIPGFNVRVDSEDYLAHRDMLVDSIRANGYDETKPIAGYVGKEDGKDVIFVTDGHTRLDAVKTFNSDPDLKTEDEITMLPVLVRRDQPSMADLTVSLHTSNSGRPLTPYELGIVVKRLLTEENADKEDIARRLAVTPRYIDDVILLAEAPVKVRNHVLAGEVSSTMAIQELRRDPKAAAERISTAVSKAQGKGKKRATAKDVGPPLKRSTQLVDVPAGLNMKELVKGIAKMIRDSIPTEGEGDEQTVARVGEIKLVIGVEAEPKPAAPAKAKKPAAKKKTPAKAKPAAEEAPEPAAEAPAKPKRRKAAAKTETPPAEEADALPVEGALPVEDEDLDLPPAPATGGVEADEVDI